MLQTLNQSLTKEVLSANTNYYISKSKADNTKKAYASDWKHFTEWCESNQRVALPADPGTVADYIAWMATQFKTATIERRISSISKAHEAAGYNSPTYSIIVKETWHGIRNELGMNQKRAKAAVIEDVVMMINTLEYKKIDVRDKTLLLIGFAGSFRRSELVSLDVEDIQFVTEGIIIHLKKSKNDQIGEGRSIGIPYGKSEKTCPVRAYKNWLEVSGIESGAVFRSFDRHGNMKERLSDHAVRLIVKRCAKDAGLDASAYSGHSLRSGFATTAAREGVQERIIAKQTGHKSMTSLRKYIHDGELFRDNALNQIGL